MADPAGEHLHALLRTLVLRTNPYFPFRYVNRWPYRLALRAVAGLGRGLPEIQAVYLRHGVASTGWIPGLSDIDLSVILASGLDAGREFDVLETLHARYRRLQRCFPMLGEMMVQAADDLPCWLAGSAHEPNPRSWVLLSGKPAIDPAIDRSPEWRTRAFDIALWIYLDLLPPVLARPQSPLRRADTARRLRKILRLLAPVLGDSRAAGGNAGPEIAGAAAALDRAAAVVESQIPAPPENRSPSAEPFRCALAFGDKALLVLENGCTESEIAAAISARSWPQPAIPVSFRTFRHLLRRFDPYNYIELFRWREVLAGEDIVPAIPGPGPAEYSAYLRSRVPEVLTFARGTEMFSGRAVFPPPGFECELRRLMGWRLLLETGSTPRRRVELDAAWPRVFPECRSRFEEFERQARRGELEPARRGLFAWFRGLARQARDSAATSGPWPLAGSAARKP